MTIIQKPTPDQITVLREAYPQGSPRVDYREMTLTRAAAKEGESGDTIPISFSSEAPVLRYDWWEDEMYYEVLDHSEKSIDLSCAIDGLPFVASHRAHDADQQHGIGENVRVETKRLVADVRFSKAARSQEIAQDVKDGIRKKVSVGYMVGDEFEQTAGKGDDHPTRRYTSWMPLEISTVPIPADYSVGIGRAKSPAGQEAFQRFMTQHPPKGRSAADIDAILRYHAARLKQALLRFRADSFIS